jgi:hypothetical protein
MSEKPIIFSGPMVRAILEGRKTQTRRVLKPQPELEWELKYDYGAPSFWRWKTCRWDAKEIGPDYYVYDYAPNHTGDRLWVRETWGEMEQVHTGNRFIVYAADGEPEDDSGFFPLEKWKPAIYMPRRASRITLEITNIRAEQLNDIAHEDATAEGCSNAEAYRELWDELNAKRGFGWDANPWVWVIEFERVEPEI